MPRRNPRQGRVQRRKTGPNGRRDAFRCVGCRLDVPFSAPGTAHRNHCPHCLTSLHLDDRTPGDRRAGCRGRMAPLSLTVRPDGEWMLIHHCLSCGELSVNRIAGDDNALVLLRIAMRPLYGARLRAGMQKVG
ncbi:RNHCP domain-containing protein [Actinomadura sp. 3N508]|uniref:RNHCP domain-containing protein n=1 Tax=Actinomadura sp. 3N508 TaxID=3375153 RepID=UPI0037B6ADDF